MLTKIGVNLASDVEAVQICPNGRGVIYVTLKNNTPMDNFICHDVIEVNNTGLKVIHIKSAGKREVVLTLKGLHPNTKDKGILDYLSKFGKISTTKVIHNTYNDGPLRGLKNGDRSVKMELKPGTSIPSYHVLYGHKVTIRYPGQKQTCARCYNSSQFCMGGGVARRCEAAKSWETNGTARAVVYVKKLF